VAEREFDDDGNPVDTTDPQAVALLRLVERRYEALLSDGSAQGLVRRAALAALAHAVGEAVRLRTMERRQ
jgi:hypothetical protein